MKKLIGLMLATAMTVSAFCVNTFAIQDDVKAVYLNELKWTAKTQQCDNNSGTLDDSKYCVYDINGDGIKELFIKSGISEGDKIFNVYSCEYGKIVRIGTINGFHADLYGYNGNGVYVYSSVTQGETLYLVSKSGRKLVSKQVYDNYPVASYNPPSNRITMYDIKNYSGLN